MQYLLLELDCGLYAPAHDRAPGTWRKESRRPSPEGGAAFSGRLLLYLAICASLAASGCWKAKMISPAGMHRLGPDIYEQVTEEKFLELLQKRPRARLKPLLLDQLFVAGLGNIYVDESLHRCRLHPCREAGSLSREEGKALFRAIRAVLEEGIRCGGTSSRDYRDARGEKGTFQERLAVYGRKGCLCRCGAAIERIVVAGRGTYYCPRCQEEKEGPP